MLFRISMHGNVYAGDFGSVGFYSSEFNHKYTQQNWNLDSPDKKNGIGSTLQLMERNFIITLHMIRSSDFEYDGIWVRVF